MPEIRQWAEIQEKYQGGTLLLGSGASMAVHPAFGYSSLREAAQTTGHLTQAVNEVFTAFGTDDFELVLRHLWQASLVNKALIVAPGRVEEAYRQVRAALIATVRDIHISYDDASTHFEAIYTFMRGFEPVLSLNYDLIVYWSMMAGNNVLGRWFKDGFQRGGVFREDWGALRNPYGADGATLVFYPHGSLITARKNDYTERQLSAAGGDAFGLLDRILEEWLGGTVVPLFVCEGTTTHKKQAISGSNYLARVFWDALPSISSTLVIYGWSISDQDEHILEQIKLAKSKLLRIAVSVYGGNQAEAQRMEAKLAELEVNELVFFDAQSPGCWIHP